MKSLDLFNSAFEYYTLVNGLNSIICILLTAVGIVLFYKTTISDEFHSKNFIQQWFIKVVIVGMTSLSLSSSVLLKPLFGVESISNWSAFEISALLSITPDCTILAR